MRILVTGAGGFLGKNFSTAVAKAHPDWEIMPFVGSILEEQDLKASFRCRPEAVVHFAAKVGALASMSSPALYARANLEGTVQLLTHAEAAGIDRFIHMSTVDVYGSARRPTEDAKIRPTSPYAITKAAADFMVQQRQGYDTVVLRAPSIYGPYDALNKMIPFFIGKVLSHAPIELFGDGLQVRDWMHVDDVARAVMLLLDPKVPRGIYNLGCSRSWSNLEVTHLLLNAMRCPEHPISFVEDVPGHGRMYAAAFAKITSMGFFPRLSIENEMPAIVRWYLDNTFAGAGAQPV